MTRWTLTPLRLGLLLGVLSVIVLVLVLPQVDLLDTAFHRDTAPAALHARAISAPSQFVAAIAPFIVPQAATADHSAKRPDFISYTPASFIPILNRSLRC